LTIIQIQEKFKIRPEEIFNIEDIKNIKSVEDDIKNAIQFLDNDKKRALWQLIKILE